VIEVRVEWLPRPPDRPLSRCERRDYRRGRDAVVREYARLSDIPVLVAEP
jgi:hypothetical protein